MALFFYQFTPLYGHNRGFTDKVGFLDHLSVKPGSKRLKSYGQKAIFNNFVRKRHFLSRRFTDKPSIFIDLSVNGGAFAKCSACSISVPRKSSPFGHFDAWKLPLLVVKKLPRFLNVALRTTFWLLKIAYVNSRTICD